MAKINLLPWRLERRKQRQKEFYSMLGGAAILAIVIAFGVIKYFDHLIDTQNRRNAQLTSEIALLDAKIKEIEELDKKKAQLLARKAVIEQLQANRSQMVHLFDALESSGWMTNPDLSIIEAKGGDKAMPFVFALKVKLIKPKKDGEGEEGDVAIAAATAEAAP
jgi:type IV pilus assembly protein PilN